MITFEEANELLRYDPETGKLYWKVSRGSKAKAGSEAGYIDATGYRRVTVNRKLYLTHRIAWLLTHGTWPENQIDHIDGDGNNNRLSNLRDVEQTHNQRNAKKRKDNTSGILGVGWHKCSKKWIARIVVDGKRVHLGIFDDIFHAIAVRKQAERDYNFHPNHGRA